MPGEKQSKRGSSKMKETIYNDIIIPQEIMVELTDIVNNFTDVYDIINYLFSADIDDIMREWLSTNTKARLLALVEAMGLK